MGLIILGKNRDDKGTQLELLTKILLRHQGFINIATNVQVGGGSELDVTAVRKDKAGIEEISTPVLCECKAHQTQITLPDWLKFIGKLSIARRKNGRTIGLMLALSGANGNVIGSYNDDFSEDNTVQLIANDDLLVLLQEIFHLSSTDEIRKSINSFPGLEADEVDLVYYKKKIYWLVSVGKNSFTLCDATGHLTAKKSVSEILPLLTSVTSFEETGYIDIFENFELQRRLDLLKVKIINEVVNGRTVNKKKLELFAREIQTGSVELENLLKDSPFLTFVKVKNRKSLRLKRGIDICDFYRYVLMVDDIVELFVSEFYQSHINDKLLEEIWKVQSGFEVEEPDISKCLIVLKLSPSALRYALTPDRMLKSYSVGKSDKEMKSLLQSHFMSQLIRCLRNDFNNPNLYKMFLTLGVNSATVEMKMKVGNKDEQFLLESKQNFMLIGVKDSDQTVMIVTKDENE